MAAFNYPKPYIHPMSMPSPAPAPVATGGKVQPPSPHGPKLTQPKTVKVKVKTHTRTRTVKPPQAPANPDQALIDAAVRLRYGPQDQALTDQLNQNTRYSSGLSDWYGNALNEIRGLQAQGQATAQQTLGQITNYASQPTLPNATDQQAAGARNNLNAEFAAMFGRDATSNSDAMDRLKATFLVQQGNTQSQANTDRMKLLASRGTLGQQKADYAQTYGAQLTQAEAKAASDQQRNDIAAKALGIKTDTLNKVQIPLANSLEQNRTNQQKVARSNVRIKKAALSEKTAADQASLQAKNEAAATKASGNGLKRSQFIAKYGLSPEKVAKMTPGQLSHFASQNPQFSGYARPTSQKTKPPTTYQLKGRQSILDSINRYQTDTKHGVPLHEIAANGRSHNVHDAFLNAGADAASKGYITPATVAMLTQLGYSVPKEWTRRGAFPITYSQPKK